MPETDLIQNVLTGLLPEEICEKLECECGSRMHRRVYSGSGDNKMYGYY